MTAKPVPATFSVGETIVYPAHGVGTITAIEEQEVAGYKLELYVVSFPKEKMTLRIPKAKAASSGLRKVSGDAVADKVLVLLGGKPRKSRVLWARRSQEYENKIKSGDITILAEVVRDLGRPSSDTGASYSERKLYEAALERLVRELSAIKDITETEATVLITSRIEGRAPAVVEPEGDEEAEAA